jgi:hypothetical protein
MANPNPFISALAKELKAKQAGQIPDLPANAQQPADFANALANAASLPELVTFAGYRGGIVYDAQQTPWLVLYHDTWLQRWLLVKETDVLYSASVTDDTSPSGKRDVIWVRADASVSGGSGSRSVEARFLTGEFTRAGDYGAPPTGGTLAAATGVFCEARTASCCRRRSQT